MDNAAFHASTSLRRNTITAKALHEEATTQTVATTGGLDSGRRVANTSFAKAPMTAVRQGPWHLSRAMVEMRTPPSDSHDDAVRSIPQLPFSRSEINRIENATACDNAIDGLTKAYKQAPASDRNIAHWVATHPAPTDEERAELATLRAALSQYESQCLATEPTPPELAELVGVFSVVGEKVCTGYRVDENHVLTARHCFYQRDTNTLWPAVASAPIWFSYPKNKGTLYEVCGEEHGAVPAGAQSFSPLADYILIQIAGQHSRPPTLPKAEANLLPGTDLRLLGLFPDLVLLADDLEHLNLRWGNRGGCVAYEVDEQCFIHACQAMPGSSGAPIFAVSGTKYSFVGVHIDRVDGGPDAACAPKKLPGSNFNVGLRLKTY